MSVEDGVIDPEELPTDPATDPAPAPGGEAAPAPTGGNPAWDSLRTELDESTFKLVEPRLREMDSAAQQRIEAINREYAWAKELKTSGADPEFIKNSVAYANMLRTNPTEVYSNLAQHLQQNFPEEWKKLSAPQKAEAAATPLGAPDADADPDLAAQSPEWAALKQRQDDLDAQQAAIAAQFSTQQQEREIAQLERQLDDEISAIRSNRADLKDEDLADILDYAGRTTQARIAAGEGKPVTLPEAVAWFDSMKTRFLSAPRPGDSAPQLLPVSGGGGNPGAPQKPDLSKMTDAEIEEMIAQDVESRR